MLILNVFAIQATRRRGPLAGVWLSAIQLVAGSEVIEDKVSRATPGTPY